MTFTESVFKKRGYWELFEFADGYDLSEASVGHVDRRGRLWLRMPRVLICTDGRNVSESHGVELDGDHVNHVVSGFTKADIFWTITSDKRLLAYRLEDGTCEDHTDNVPSMAEAYWMWTSQHEDILIGIPGKVVHYDGKKSVAYDVPTDEEGKVRHATMAPNGDAWVYTDRGLHQFSESGVTLYDNDFLGMKKMWEFRVDANGDVWCPEEREVFVLRASSSGQLDCVAKDTLHSVYPDIFDNEGNLWGFSFYIGVFCINAHDTVIFPLGEMPGIKAPRRIVQDKTGSMWCIGVGNGISRYNPTRLNVLGNVRIEAATMAGDGSIMLAAAANGLLEYRGEGLKQICSEAIYGCHSICLAGDGKVYLATGRNGMSRCDISEASLKQARDIPGWSALDTYDCHSTAVDQDGFAWAAIASGLYRLAETEATEFKWSDFGIMERGTSLFADSDGTIWIAGDVRRPVTHYTKGKFTRFAEKVGVGVGAVSCFFEENDDYIWFCTNKGSVLRGDRKTGKFKLMMSLGSLIQIYDFRMDGRGLMWISTSKGLLLADQQNNYFLQESCGLPGRKVLKTWELDDGCVAIVTEYGLCEYVYSDANRPAVYISRLEADQVHYRPAEVVLYESLTKLTIHIGAVNMKQGPLKYQVRLLGQNNRWLDSWSSEISYENLPLGKYTFEARAVDQDLMTTAEPARVSIEVIEDPREKAIYELEGELRGAKDFAANIIKSINESIIVLDPKGVIVAVNDATQTLLGRTEDELLAHPAGRLFPEQGACLLDAAGIIRFAKDGRLKAHEQQFMKANGDSIPVLLSGSCMHDSKGELQGFVLAASDLSEYKQLQSQMLHSQKMDSLGVLAGGIAHDFNNMLAVILGNAELCLNAAEEGSQSREHLRDVIAASEQAAKLCSEMLAYAGKEQTIRVAVDLSKMVEHNAELLRSSISRKIDLKCDLPEGLPKVFGDEVQLMQIVMNFITNAAEAIGDNEGTIYLSTKCGKFNQKELASPYSDTTPPPGEYVVLEIRDTGCGMNRETAARIFEPFFTTKFTGRGLGLSAVHGIVNSHGAALTLDSKPGKGSRFRVFCPVLAQELAVVKEEKAPQEPVTGTGTALIIDDEEALLTLASTIFKRMGFDTITAGDGVDGLQKFKKNMDKISVVFLDIMMPRMDGAETYGHIRHFRADVPVIICSGYSEADISSRFIDDEKLHFVQKPYTLERVAAKVAEALRS